MPLRNFAVIGTVTDNEDDLNLGRIRARVPNLLEPESHWAWPVGVGGGKDRARWAIPRVGDTVVLFFLYGEISKPIYFHGLWSAPEGNSEVPDQAENSTDVAVTKFENFFIKMDSRSGQKKLIIKDLNSGNEFKFDSENSDGELTINNDYNIKVSENYDLKVDNADLKQTVNNGKKDVNILQGNSDETVAVGDKNNTISSGSWISTIGDTLSWIIGGISSIISDSSSISLTSTIINLIAGASSIAISSSLILLTGVVEVVGSLTISGGIINKIPSTPLTLGQPSTAFKFIMTEDAVAQINTSIQQAASDNFVPVSLSQGSGLTEFTTAN